MLISRFDYSTINIHSVNMNIQDHQEEDVGEDIVGARVCTPFTEPNELHVKDEVKDSELLKDSIEVLKIYKLL